MKKVISGICIILLMILFTFTSCKNLKNFSKQDEFVFAGELDCDKIFEDFISAVEQKNTAQLNELFSENISEKPDFSKQTDMLFDFYTGVTQSYSKDAEYVSGDRNDGNTHGETRMSYIVYSSTGKYCVAIQYCTADSKDKGNIGITSLYIAKQEDDSQFTYWGNGEWKEGINIEQ